jgi:hypothetical protein
MHAISRLLELGVLRTTLGAFAAEEKDEPVKYWTGARYELTRFGQAVFGHLMTGAVESDEAKALMAAKAEKAANEGSGSAKE